MQEDYYAILEADNCRKNNDRIGTFNHIKEGLTYNYKNYELYYMLGEYYLDENPKKAYLCFENAEFYCNNIEDLSIISQSKNNLIEQGISVPNISIIILSYNASSEMQLCLDSLRKFTYDISREIIVIDNASTDGVTDYLRKQTDIKLVCNSKNIGFPAGCNQGIKLASPENDILLLNNDTVITPNSIFWLRMGLYENDSIGGTGSISNRVGNYQQIAINYDFPSQYIDFAIKNNIPLEYPYENKLKLIGFAFLLKKSVLDNVGLLDEQFTPGNYEDDDLSFRIVKAGYKLLLCRNSFIYHFGSRSFSKDINAYNLLLQKNAEKFRKKWGFDAHYYCYERRNFISFIHNSSDSTLNILEIGCGMGATLGYIKNTYPNANIYGVELNSNIADIAKHYIPTIICGNIESMELPYEENFFDYIIFADVLEHLINPHIVLSKIKKYLKPSGCILASIPNIMHYSVILDLLKGNFTYQDSGILDKTHLRFFTLNEINHLFSYCGYKVSLIETSTYDLPLSSKDQKLFNELLDLPGIASETLFHAYQYFIKATNDSY